MVAQRSQSRHPASARPQDESFRAKLGHPWGGRLALIGSEAGGEHGGYMEGALLAVDAALSRVLEALLGDDAE